MTDYGQTMEMCGGMTGQQTQYKTRLDETLTNAKLERAQDQGTQTVHGLNVKAAAGLGYSV